MVNDLLCTSDKQISARSQASLELAEDFILRFLSKIDQYVPAYNQMIVCRISIF